MTNDSTNAEEQEYLKEIEKIDNLVKTNKSSINELKLWRRKLRGVLDNLRSMHSAADNFIKNCAKIKELLSTIQDEILALSVEIEMDRQNSEKIVQEFEDLNDDFLAFKAHLSRLFSKKRPPPRTVVQRSTEQLKLDLSTKLEKKPKVDLESENDKIRQSKKRRLDFSDDTKEANAVKSNEKSDEKVSKKPKLKRDQIKIDTDETITEDMGENLDPKGETLSLEDRILKTRRSPKSRKTDLKPKKKKKNKNVEIYEEYDDVKAKLEIIKSNDKHIGGWLKN